MKNIIFILILTLIAARAIAADSLDKEYNYLFPKAYKSWDFHFIAGLSLTKLPTAIVEEEINSSPMLNFGVRLGLPIDLSVFLEVGTNYIANIGHFAVQWSLLNKGISAAVGMRYSAWFGHLEMNAFNIKSSGMIAAPYITSGIDFSDFTLTGELSVESNYLYTTSDNVYLGEWFQPVSGVALKLAIEQPMWNDNYVILAAKLNYSKFYYQSWLSFSIFNEYLFYPEFSFSFIL